jgi:hypothetical protein
VRPADRQRFIEEVTQALAAASETKDFRLLQEVLQAWTATIRAGDPGRRVPGAAAPRATAPPLLAASDPPVP